MPLRRAGTVTNAGIRYGPGSAAHRSAKSFALRCVRGTKKDFSFINIKFSKPPGDSYPPLPNRSYDRRVLSNEGALLEGTSEVGQSESLAGAG